MTTNGITLYQSNDPSNVIAPTPINTYSTLTIPAYFRAMNFIADNMASFPRAVHLDNAPAPDGHPLDRLLERRPNGYQNPTQFFRAWFFHAAHFGNGLAEIKRDNRNRPTLHNLPSDEVIPFRFDRNDGAGLQQYYVYGEGPTRRILAGSDVLHLQGLSFDGMAGIDVVRLMSETFQRSKCLDRFMTRYLVKGTVVRGAIEIPTGISDEKIDEIIEALRTHFAGVESERDVLVLSDGAKLNNATLTPSDGQLIQQAAYGTKQVSQITGVPPEFLFELSEAKYNTSVEQAGQNVVRYLFRPIIEQAEDELSLKLLSDAELDAGYRIHIDPDALLRGDSAAISSTTVAEVNAGLITKNEGRARLSMPRDTDPESDKLQEAIGSTAKPITPPAKSSASPAQARAFNAMKPTLKAAIARIETKSDKAFESAKTKDGQARTIWSNVFADEQARYVTESLSPIAETLKAIDGPELPIATIAERYAAALRRRAATSEATDLYQIIFNALTPGAADNEPKE